MNYLNNIAAARRSSTAAKQNRRTSKSKQVDENQTGRLCTVETPEGEMCGNARFQAIGSTVSTASSSKVLQKMIKTFLPAAELCDILFRYDQPDHYTIHYPFMVEIDGHLVWRCRSGTAVVNCIRQLRRKRLISAQVGCNLEENIVRVRTSPGRNLRLLLILKPWFRYLATIKTQDAQGAQGAQAHLAFMSPLAQKTQGAFLYETSLNQALSLGLVEYIDAMEERGLALAWSYADFVKRSALGEVFSHMELDGSWQWGMTAGSLPQPNKNQAPRSVLASAMMKQTFSSITNPYRLNTLSHCLDYPQRPLSQKIGRAHV